MSHPLDEEGTLGNAAAQAVVKAREEMLAARARSDLVAVMSTVEGRRLLWGLIDGAGVFGPSFTADPYATAFNEGRRSNGLGLMTRCQVETTDLYIKALAEDLAERRTDALTREAAKATPPQENE